MRARTTMVTSVGPPGGARRLQQRARSDDGSLRRATLSLLPALPHDCSWLTTTAVVAVVVF